MTGNGRNTLFAEFMNYVIVCHVVCRRAESWSSLSRLRIQWQGSFARSPSEMEEDGGYICSSGSGDGDDAPSASDSQSRSVSPAWNHHGKDKRSSMGGGKAKVRATASAKNLDLQDFDPELLWQRQGCDATEDAQELHRLKVGVRR